MKINNPHDFTDNASSNDDLIQTTRCIQKSCHELQQELAEITSSSHLPPVFNQGLERELDKLQGCATSFLRKYGD